MTVFTRAQLAKIFQYRLTRWVLGISLAYLAVCLVVIVPLLNWSAGTLYKEQTGRTLKSDIVTFNPLSLSINARNVEDHNPDGSLFWSAQHLHFNLSLLQSLFHGAIALDEVVIDGVQMHPHLLANGRWNFADILQHQAELATSAPAKAETSELPSVIIDNIQLVITALQFTDSSLKETFTTRLDNIHFELQGFSTLADAGQAYSLSATTPDAGALGWKGTLSVKSGQSQGELAIKNINLLPVWQYLRSSVNFTLQSALLSATGHYQAHWKDAFSWSITQAQIDLTQGKLRSGKRDARNVEMALSGLNVQGVAASSQTQQLDIGAVQVNGLRLTSWSRGSDSGLIRAFMPDNTGSSDTDKPWLLLVKTFAINNAAINWRAAELEQRLIKLDQLNFTATNIDTSGKQNMDIRFASRIDQDSQVTATGGFNLTSLDGDFSSQLQNLPVAIAQPLLTPYARADIAAGQLHTNVELQVRNAELTRIKTNGSLTDVKLRPAAATQELVTWASMKWSDAELDLVAQKIDVPLLELSGFDSRFELREDGTTNLQSLFPPVVATPDAARPTPQAKAPAEADKPWDFTLQKLALEKSSFRFNDQSLTPNFTAAVQNFNGTLTGLSSDTRKPAVFKFHGDVDGYAPVNLQGHVHPFLKQPQLDARLDFENMDLGGFSGYSSTYAGWRIERGLLTANLHYRLKEGSIVGDNHIEMDQLQLGERVANAEAADIPLRLALALITDENGLATLDIGVSGNTNQPSFDLRTVIRQAVRNTFVKIVKSPFTLLANLVGSKEDLGQLPFNSGSSQLLTTATRKLNSLQQALKKRPELRIELRGHYDQNTDRRGLQAAHIKQQLLERGLSSADIKAKKERWQKAVAEEYRALKLSGDQPLSPEQMYEQWLQTIAVAPEALTQLAAQRSINAKQFLVQQLKVDSSRVLINSNLDCSEAEMCSRRIVRLDLSDLNQTLPSQ